MERSTKVFRQQLTVALPLFILITFHACLDDEDKGIQSSTIQFVAGAQSVPEGKEATIYLELDKPASIDGYITVQIVTTEVYNQHFTTDPVSDAGTFTIPLVKGQKSAHFKVTTVDNASFDEGKFITFTLGVRTYNLKLGLIATCSLRIEDDEGPSLASFETGSDFIDETNAAGIDVKIQLSKAATGKGRIELDIISLATYGTNFTTLPAATNNIIGFEISPGQTNVAFKVFPINNTHYTDTLIVSFSIGYVNGAVKKGANSFYSLIIVDDEEPAIVNFETSSGSVNENSPDGIMVNITFSKPAIESGTFVVNLFSDNSQYGRDFTTEPAGFGSKIAFEVIKDQTSASFRLLPIDNSYANYYRIVHLSLLSMDASVQVGNNIDYVFTIIDNEIVEASFAEGSASIAENNSSGILVKINFSKPLSQTTQFIVQGPDEYGQVLYGSVYYTNPVMTGYTAYYCDVDNYYYCYYPTPYTNHLLLLLGQKGDTSAAFTIIPLDNEGKGVNRDVSFNLLSLADSPLMLTDGEFTLTLVDND